MPKFSVKKPLTIFVAVIAVLVLGIVAYTKMTPDLLPNMDFPYVVVMTSYPGASPETVETELSKPMEQAMATLSHIKTVTSTSNENYALVMLEFDDDVDLDTITVDIQQKLSALEGTWDDKVSSPVVMKINPSMLPVEVAALSMEGMDNLQLSQFMEDTLQNQLEGITGVASVSSSGSITKELHVQLSQDKIDALNETIAASVGKKLDDAKQELEDTRQELEDAKQELEDGKEQLSDGKTQLAEGTAAAESTLSGKRSELTAARMELQDQITALQQTEKTLTSGISSLTALRDGRKALSDGKSQLETAKAQLEAAKTQYETLQTAKAAFDAQLKAINDSALSDEEKAAAVAQIQESAAYVQTMSGLAQLEAGLAASGVTADTLDASISSMDAQIAALDEKLAALDATLASQNMTADSLDASIETQTAALSQVQDGIAQLKDTVSQLDSGAIQLDEAQKTLSAQKTAGLLTMAETAAQLSVGSANVENGLTQVESGLDTLEESRQDALSQADLSDKITMQMISSILTAQNFSMPAGSITENGVSCMVSVGDKLETQEDLEDLLLMDLHMDGVEPIRLSDVSDVVLTDNSADVYAKLNGEDGMVLSFQKQSTFATAEVSQNIADRFEALETEYPGLHFVSLMDQGDYIHMIINSILQSLLFGAIFAVIILFLFLRDLRPTFITLCSIPISVIFAVVLMYFSGVTINMISLSGLAVAVGMLVDNSVVVIENIYRLRAQGKTAVQAAVAGASQVVGAITASTLTTICVFLPIVFVEGITKQLFTDLALTMTYSLLASLIVALTLVPAMAAGMLKKEKKQKDGFMARVYGAYRKAGSWALGHKALILISSLVLLLVSAGLSLSQGFIFMPEMDMNSLTVNVTMEDGTEMADAVSVSDTVLSRIEEVPGVVTTGAMMGSGSLLSGSMGGGSGALSVSIYVTLEDGMSGKAAGEQITALCEDLPCTVDAGSSMMSMEMLTGSGISMNLYEEDMEKIQQEAKQAAEVLNQVPGVTDVSDGLEDAAPALHVRIDRDKAMEKGFTVAQIYAQLAKDLQSSQTATEITLRDTSADVIVETQESKVLTRDNLEDELFSYTDADGEGATFRLSDVAEVEDTVSLSSISRIDQRRYVTVTASIADGYNVTKVTAAAEAAMKDAGLTADYEFSGENKSIMDAVQQLLLMLLLGILLVYLVMVAQFQSLKSPFIVMFTIPLAFTGGFLALLLCGKEVSVISLIGFVMLTGVIVNNGIVLVDYINQLRQDGMERREAILEAGVTRLRPILMTSLTTILGLLVMAFGADVGTALMQPVALVCIGGLLYATFMTLFVVPCMYDMMNKKELRKVEL